MLLRKAHTEHSFDVSSMGFFVFSCASVELRNLFVFPTKIRLMNDRFHIPAHQSAKLQR